MKWEPKSNGEGDITRRVRAATDTVEKRFKRWRMVIVSACSIVVALTGIAAIGFRGRGTLDGKADAQTVAQLNERVAVVEAQHKEENTWHERLEKKLDWVMMHLSPANTPAVGAGRRAR